MVPALRFNSFKYSWKEVLIEDLFDFKNGLNKEKEYFGRGTPIINFMDVYRFNHLVSEKILGLVELNESEIERFSARRGDVFFTRTSESIHDIGMSATLIENINRCVFSGFVLRARPKTNNLIPLFSGYLLNTEYLRKEIVVKSSMTTRALTSGTLLNKVSFSYPIDTSEQQKIADFLSSVDKKIEQLTRKKELLEKYKTGMMQKLFPKAGEQHPELRFQDENGQDYPDWVKYKLSDIGVIITGNTPSTSKEEFYGGVYHFISPADINSDRFVLKTKTSLTKLGFAECRVVEKGSVLFVCIGSTIGKVAQTLRDCATNQQINSITCNKNNLNDFLYSLLEFNAARIAQLAGNQAVPIINKSSFGNYAFYFPSLTEQQKIADFLSAIDDKITKVEGKLTKAQTFKKGLLQQMFV